MVERVEVAREIAQANFVPNGNEKARGRPKEAGSVRDIAERTGIPQTTVVKAEQHVETAEAFPVFQKPDWKQYHVLEAREALHSSCILGRKGWVGPARTIGISWSSESQTRGTSMGGHIVPTRQDVSEEIQLVDTRLLST